MTEFVITLLSSLGDQRDIKNIKRNDFHGNFDGFAAFFVVFALYDFADKEDFFTLVREGIYMRKELNFLF